MFERLKELICDMAKFLARLGAGLILSALPISNKESHFVRYARRFGFPCRPHKTRASGRDRMARLYARGAACYPRDSQNLLIRFIQKIFLPACYE